MIPKRPVTTKLNSILASFHVGVIILTKIPDASSRSNNKIVKTKEKAENPKESKREKGKEPFPVSFENILSVRDPTTVKVNCSYDPIGV